MLSGQASCGKLRGEYLDREREDREEKGKRGREEKVQLGEMLCSFRGPGCFTPQFIHQLIGSSGFGANKKSECIGVTALFSSLMYSSTFPATRCFNARSLNLYTLAYRVQ